MHPTLFTDNPRSSQEKCLLTYLGPPLVVTKRNSGSSRNRILFYPNHSAIRQPKLSALLRRHHKIFCSHIFHSPQLPIRQLNKRSLGEVTRYSIVVKRPFGRSGGRACRHQLAPSRIPLEVKRCWRPDGSRVFRPRQDPVLERALFPGRNFERRRRLLVTFVSAGGNFHRCRRAEGGRGRQESCAGRRGGRREGFER